MNLPTFPDSDTISIELADRQSSSAESIHSPT